MIKRTCQIVDFVPADHGVKLNKAKRGISTSTVSRKWKKLWKMKVTIIPIVIRALGTATKGLVQGQEDLEITGRSETVKTTALLRSAKIPRRAVTQNPVESDQLMLTWKPLKEKNNNNNIFDHTNKSYMHNPAPVLENDTHKLLWDFNIQTDQKTRPYNNQQKKGEFAKLSTLLSRQTTE